MGFSVLLYKLQRPATNRHTVEEPADLTVPHWTHYCRGALLTAPAHRLAQLLSRDDAATACASSSSISGLAAEVESLRRRSAAVAQRVRSWRRL